MHEATQNSYGSDFILGFLPFGLDTMGSPKLNIHVTNHENETVKALISGSNTNVSNNSIPAHATWIYAPEEDPVYSQAERNKGFRVASFGKTIGVTISVHDLNNGDSAYRVLPYLDYSNVEQYEYFVPYGNSINSVLLVAAENETIIHLTSPLPLSIPADLSPSGHTENLAAVNITLHELQTFLLTTDSSEYSFIKISSNVPIAVFFGNPVAQVIGAFGQLYSTDFMGGQMPPTVTWGQSFLIQVFPLDPASIVFIASNNSTTLQHTCSGADSNTYTLAEGEVSTIDVVAGLSCSAVSSKPMAVIFISLFPQDESFTFFDGGRSLTVLPPVEQFLESVMFPPIANFPSDQCAQCDLVAILATAGTNSNISQVHVLVDGTLLGEDVWMTVQLPNGTILGFVTNQMFNLAVHTIQSTSSDTRIAAVVHRITLFKAVTFSAGTNLLPLHGKFSIVTHLQSLFVLYSTS